MKRQCSWRSLLSPSDKAVEHPTVLNLALRRQQPFSFGRWQLLTCVTPLFPAETFGVGMLTSTPYELGGNICLL